MSLFNILGQVPNPFATATPDFGQLAGGGGGLTGLSLIQVLAASGILTAIGSGIAFVLQSRKTKADNDEQLRRQRAEHDETARVDSQQKYTTSLELANVRLEAKLENMDKRLVSQQEDITRVNAELAQHRADIRVLTNDLAERDETIKRQSQLIDELRATITRMELAARALERGNKTLLEPK